LVVVGGQRRPSRSGFSGALGYDLLLFYRQVARRLGQPTKFSDRLAYTHRIDPSKAGSSSTANSSAPSETSSGESVPATLTIHGFSTPSSQQTATLTETRRPVTTPTDLAQPTSGPSVPPLPAGTDTGCRCRVPTTVGIIPVNMAGGGSHPGFGTVARQESEHRGERVQAARIQAAKRG